MGFERSTLAWHAGQLIRMGQDHAGIILFRGSMTGPDYGHQARVPTEFWESQGKDWDWINRMVCLPRSV